MSGTRTFSLYLSHARSNISSLSIIHRAVKLASSIVYPDVYVIVIDNWSQVRRHGEHLEIAPSGTAAYFTREYS